MGNKELKQNKITENILMNLIHDIDVMQVLSKFGLRMFYSNGLRLAYPVKDFTKMENSYVECDIHVDKAGKPDYVCGDTKDFSIILYIKKKDSNYTYSKFTYYDKLKRKPYEIQNSNLENTNGIGYSIKKLFLKRKK